MEFIAIPRGVMIVDDLVAFIAQQKQVSSAEARSMIMPIEELPESAFSAHPVVIGKGQFDSSVVCAYMRQGPRLVEQGRYFREGQEVALRPPPKKESKKDDRRYAV